MKNFIKTLILAIIFAILCIGSYIILSKLNEEYDTLWEITIVLVSYLISFIGVGYTSYILNNKF